jgi:DNA helicase-2/ATP-dependent DNA helicase PcrA
MEYATEGIRKELHGQFHGAMPKLIVTSNNSEEDNYILREILKYSQRGIDLREMAVIVRNSSQSYGLENLLDRYGIPYDKFGGLKFMEKVAVRDILSFLRLIVNQKDEIALYRVLQLYPGIGKTYSNKITASVTDGGFDTLKNIYPKNRFHIYLEELFDVIQKLQTKTLQEQLEYLLEDYYPMAIERSIENSKISESSKMEQKQKMHVDIEDTRALYTMASNYRRTNDFLEDIVLDATKIGTNEDRLNITTIHSAKGLEYDVVFVMDVVEQITPKCQMGSEEDPEELRCLYVAITRARKYLYLTVPQMHNNPQFHIFNCMLSHFINYDEVLDCLDCNVSHYQLARMRDNTDMWDIY